MKDFGISQYIFKYWMARHVFKKGDKNIFLISLSLLPSGGQNFSQYFSEVQVFNAGELYISVVA